MTEEKEIITGLRFHCLQYYNNNNNYIMGPTTVDLGFVNIFRVCEYI